MRETENSLTLSKIKMTILSSANIFLFYFVIIGLIGISILKSADIFSSLQMDTIITTPTVENIIQLQPLQSGNGPLSSITDPFLLIAIKLYTHPAIIGMLVLFILYTPVLCTLIPIILKQPYSIESSDIIISIFMYIFVQFCAFLIQSSLLIAVIPYHLSISETESLISSLQITSLSIAIAVSIYTSLEIMGYITRFLNRKSSSKKPIA